MDDVTVSESIAAYLVAVQGRNKKETVRAYKSRLAQVAAFLNARCFESGTMLVSSLTEDSLVSFFASRKSLSYNTMALDLWAVVGWCRYLTEQGLRTFSISRLKQLIIPYMPKRVVYTRSLPDPYDLSRVVEYALGLSGRATDDEAERLRLLRDRALIALLADTQLEPSAVEGLCRGDVDWKQRQLRIRGDRAEKNTVALTPRAIQTLRDYLDARARLDRGSGRPLVHLPLFAGHRPNQTGQLGPLTYRAVGKVISVRAAEALGPDYDGGISATSFQHYQANTLLETIGLLHTDVVQRCEAQFRNHQYDDAILNAMKCVEEEIRSRIRAEPADIGVVLVSKAMQAKPPDVPAILFSKIPAEQEAAHSLFRGAIGSFKNPHSHRFVEVSDPVEAFECLALASLLMRMLDAAEYLA